MNRLVLLLLVGFLAITTGGILDLMLPEPCSPAESASSPADGACPATCIRCHCTRAFDLAFHLEVGDRAVLGSEWLPLSASVPQPIPRDIMHVPKPTLA
ncbi:MAG: hypothetical protein GEU82_07750 [Luteitalea sp.]|nr:hypothetical protein [Luteitalea sp.]